MCFFWLRGCHWPDSINKDVGTCLQATHETPPFKLAVAKLTLSGSKVARPGAMEHRLESAAVSLRSHKRNPLQFAQVAEKTAGTTSEMGSASTCQFVPKLIVNLL